MGLRTVIKTAGHWLKGSIFKVDSEIQFDATSNPEIDSTGGSFVWKTQTNNPTSWSLEDPTTGETILLLNTATAAKVFTLNSNYSAQGFGLFGLFSQTAQGPTVTNTTTETDILGTGVGSLSVPANGFQVGDSYHAKIGGTISAQNGDDITIRIKNGATVLASTGVISLEAVTALAWEIEIDFTVRTIGATGQIFTNGNFAYNRNTGSLEGFVFSDTEVIDTTASSTLMITAEWGQAKTQDIIFVDMTNLSNTY